MKDKYTDVIPMRGVLNLTKNESTLYVVLLDLKSK